MTPYSRRQFLQLAGITLLGTQFSLHSSLLQGNTGRAFSALPVYRARNLQSPVLRHLWPDSIVSILNAYEDWYEVPGGYVAREGIQPMTPYIPNTSIQLPHNAFWAEVTAPVAPVRQWCAADAPLIARIGHGGTARVIDGLPGNQPGTVWYGVETAPSGLLGWTQAVYWQPVHDEPFLTRNLTLHVDREAQQLAVYENDEAILLAQISTGIEIEPGAYPLQSRYVTGTLLSDTDALFHGIPWRIMFGESYELTGAYWHNQFGRPNPGPAIQVTPLLARWLYRALGDNGQIVIG